MKRRILSILMLVAMIAGMFPCMPADKVFAEDNDLILWYRFDEGSGTTVADSSGNGLNGTLNGGTSWSTASNGKGAVEFDGKSGYLQMPNGILSGITDITVTASVYVDASNVNPTWIFTFGSSNDAGSTTGTKYFGLLEDSSGNFRATITTNRWTGEQNIKKGSALSTGVWKHVAVTLSGDTGILYEDGVQIAQNTSVTIDPKDIEPTIANYLAKPAYTADKYFKGKISDFRIYKRALSASEIQKIWIESLSDEDAVEAVKGLLDLGDTSAVMSDMNLPTTYAGVSISWSSDNKDIIADDGTVTRPDEDTEVKLTATISKGSSSDTKIFTVKVLKKGTVIRLDSYEYTLYPNKTHATVVTAFYDDGSSEDVTKDATFESSDTSVATVDALGVVKGIKPGKATITVTYQGQKYQVNVNVMQDLLLWYKFDETSGTTVADSSGNGLNGTLNGGASWLSGNGIEFDGSSGYVQMPNNILEGLNSITISVNVYVDPENKVPSWIFTFGSSTDPYNDTNAHYLGLLQEASDYRVMLAKNHWSDEQNTKVTSAFTKGIWKHVAYTQTGPTGTLYVDGVQVAQNTNVAYTPQDIEPTIANYIGKPAYLQDKYFKGKIRDFRIYNRALSASEIKEMSAEYDSYSVKMDKEVLTLGDTSAVVNDLTLPTIGEYGSSIEWISSNETYLTTEGKVYRPAAGQENQTVELTAVIRKGLYEETKIFQVTILADITDQEKVDAAAEKLSIINADDIRGNITLPEEIDGIKIKWTASPEGIISTETVPAEENGNYAPIPAGVVKRGDKDTKVTLTATLTLNGKTATKDIVVTVKAAPKALSENDYKAYLFVYFTGESSSDGEQIYFASSTDGLHWKELNDNDPVLVSTVGDKGVRDPYIIRSPEGDKFYLIATDLRIANGAGWSAAQTAGSKSIVVWESNDLVHWSKERLVKVARDDAGCTWAPEAVYDDKTGEYIVFWASRIAEDNYAKQRIYMAKTRDFYTFTEPEVYIERENDVIDATIIKHDGIYYRFSKDEVKKNIVMEKCDQLLGKEFERISAPVVESQSGVEGPAIFKFNGENKWCLLLDQYGGIGYYPLVSDDIASGEFRVLDSSQYSLPSRPRHGTVIPITQAEYDAIQAKWAGEVVPPDEEEQEGPILQYDFEETSTDNTIQDVSGNGYRGSLHGNAVYVMDEEKGSKVLYLDGTSNTFAAFPQGFFDGRDTVSISMDIKAETVTGNFFTFTIGKNDTKYMFLRTRDNEIRNAITVNSWSAEQEVKATTDSIKGKWMNLKLVITPTSMAIYKDGRLLSKNNNVTISISDLGANLLAYLGKSFYSADAYFKGYFDNVKVYNRALSELEIAKEFGITDFAVIKGVSAENYSIIKTEIDSVNRKLKVYFSRNNSVKKDLTQVPLTYELLDGCTLDGENGATVDLSNPVVIGINVLGQEKQYWTVEGVLCNNPILSGQYADPDIDIFGDTYYIYPTTDGFTGWSGTEFHVFSSKDLINWKDEGVILDVATDDVPWAVGSAWAPTIEEKNGKYYFYFCAKRSDGKSCIGVAVSDSPTGPFKAQTEPLITPEIASAEGISMGQTIDPSIFTDDDGTSYMLFGNGNAAVVQLNDDMTSFKPGTMKNISGATDFREAITVVKRNGVYHFTWSCDDTGSENYHVNYGVSDNIYGPITYKYTILSKDASKDILGTGHHSILKIPEKDEYYIAYHRFVTPLGQYTSGLGYHRETCLDKMEFDENGYIKIITPTLEGITEPVTIVGEQPVTGVSLNTTRLILEKGTSATLIATVTPENATNKNVTWESSDTDIATIDTTGKVTAIEVGTATITVTTEDGGYRATCTVTVTVTKQSSGSSKKDRNKTSSSTEISESTTQTTTPSTTPTVKQKTFNDLGGYEWAKEAIENLAAKGIIKGTTETTFEPGKNITRADFITLLVRALNLKADFETNFDDVKEGTYYYETIGIAKQLGIAKGAGENKFNPQAHITRQDMMVMVARALEIAGKALPSVDITDLNQFSDAGSISDYAKESAAKLIKEGIIKGSGGLIEPKSNAIRAQVAVIIYRLIEK